MPSLTAPSGRSPSSSNQHSILKAMYRPPTTSNEYNKFCQELITRLENIVAKKYRLRALHLLQGEDAQRAFDLLKTLSTHPTFSAELKGKIVVAMQRIARRRNLSPRLLVGVQTEAGFQPRRGGFGDVYRGSYQRKVVCVKKLVGTGRTPTERMVQLCAKEAILWGSLDHPNILQFIGVCELDGVRCLISPWASGGTITEYLKDRPNANRLRFGADMADGLNYLHSLDVIHGDIKPANVLIDTQEDPRAVLADFGISSLSGEGIVEITSFSSVCSLGGTVRWQAPELLAATSSTVRVRNTRESDIWALGCTFYEIFVGELPYFTVANIDIKDHVFRQGKRLQRPDEGSPAWRQYGLTRWMWHLFEKCWRTEPKDRPPIERIARSFKGWIASSGQNVRSQSQRRPCWRSQMFDVVYRMEALHALEDLLETVEATNGQLTEPSTPEPEDERTERDRFFGRKHPRSFPERENRASKRARTSDQTRLPIDLVASMLRSANPEPSAGLI